MWTTQVCFACLTWLYGPFVRTLISLTLKCIHRLRSTHIKFYWAFSAWVGPFSLQMGYDKVELKVDSNELHNYAQMYRNVNANQSKVQREKKQKQASSILRLGAFGPSDHCGFSFSTWLTYRHWLWLTVTSWIIARPHKASYFWRVLVRSQLKPRDIKTNTANGRPKRRRHA